LKSKYKPRIFQATNITDVVISNLQIDGNKAEVTEVDTAIVIEQGTKRFIVENCYIHDGKDRGIAVTLWIVTPVEAKEGVIKNNIIEACDGEGIFLKNAKRVVIANNLVLSCGKTGIAFWAETGQTSDYNIIAHNICKDNSYNGIHLDISANYNIVVGNICEGNGYRGIRVTPTTGTAICNVIAGNMCKGNGNDGIELISADYNVIVHNTIEKNQYHGLRMYACDENIVCSNIVKDNSQAGAQLYDGIRLDGDSARNIVSENRVFGANHYYGVRGVDTENYNTIVGNVLTGNYKALSYVGANDVVKRNLGHRSENAGVATFSGDGVTTSFSWAHGLVGAPSVILITPKSADAAITHSVSADATNITITFTSAPAAGTNNVVLAWYAEV